METVRLVLWNGPINRVACLFLQPFTKNGLYLLNVIGRK